MMQIIPALLVHSSEEYFSQLRAILHLVPRIHLDIANNTLVPGTTWADREIVQDATPVDIELHLMVDDPIAIAKEWKHVPQVTRYIIHAEAPIDHLGRAIAGLKKHHKTVRLALNPETGAPVLDPYLPESDGVMFMAIRPGLQGQPFVPAVVEKIAAFHHEHPAVHIAVDGHVDKTTLPVLAKAGATEFCVGSAIFHNNERTPEENYLTLGKLTRAG